MTHKLNSSHWMSAYARRSLVVAVFAVWITAIALLGCSAEEPAPPATVTTTTVHSGTSGRTLPSTTTGIGDGSARATTGGSASGGSTQTGGMHLADVNKALLTGNFARCPECHSLLDLSASRNSALTKRFAHGFHLEKGATCDQCHEVPTHTSTEVRKPTMLKCFGCHSQTDKTKPTGACAACHPPGFSLKPQTHSDPTWLPPLAQLVTTRATHPTAWEKSPKECELCHAPTFCTKCHGIEMPHPLDWQKQHSSQAAKVGNGVCMKCHFNNETCRACHHPGYKPGGPPWWQIHPNAVYNEGPDRCFRCHSTRTCAHCHTTGEYKDFVQ
ncbi:MAG: hypothetical protein M1337_06270 [Actinobacteria bacterium]|nr:hypothetical protein [Actinomycetota bacterium]